MMNFQEYILPELLSLIPVLNIIGYYLKNITKIKDKYIPLILGGTGVLLACTYTIGVCGVSSIFTGVVQGVLVAAVSVYANQIYKQSKEEE